MPSAVPLRLPRASVFAAVCVTVSAGGHDLTSGHGVAPLGLAAGFALALAVGHWLAGSERRLGVLSGAMVWCQLALHLLFTTASSPPALAPAGHGLEHAAGQDVLTAPGVGPGMLLAHAASGLVCAWWLRQGERAVFDLVGLLRSLFRSVLPLRPSEPPALPLVRSPRFDHAVTPTSRLLLLRHVRVLRGPPAAFLI